MFDDLDSGCCPDAPEGIALALNVPGSSFVMTAPPGFHDLELRGVTLDFLGFGGPVNVLDGASIPPSFPDLAWAQSRFFIDVHDPVHGRDGRAFLEIQSLTTTLLAPVPTLSRLLIAYLVALRLGAAAWRRIGKE